MSKNSIFSQKKTNGISIDKIIEKFIPIIGAILLTIGVGYLLYTNVWVDLPLEARLGFGFFLSLTIIGGAMSFSDKLRYFADIIIGIGILLLYGTLMYGSRTTEAANAVIPEIATLVTAFIFTFIIAYFASKRKSKVILIISMIGAYITPFVIGQNDVWAQSISFNAYLTYFTAINIVVFFIGKELSIRNIIPLNMLGLFIGTSTLYKLSYTDGISNIINSNFLSSEIFSAILFLLLSVFSIWSIIISSKQFEEKDEGYIAFGYIASILWFIFNISLLSSIGDISKTIFFALLSGACFFGWHFLRNTKTRFQHTSLYAGGILSAVIAFFSLIPELNVYSSLVISYSSLIFGGIYVTKPKKIERLITYGLLSVIGALLSILFIYDKDSGIESFKTVYVVGALLPAMMGYSITTYSKNKTYIELSRVYSMTAFAIAIMFILVDFLKYIDYSFMIYFIVPFMALIYTRFFAKASNNSKSIILRSAIIWFLLGYIGVFFVLLASLYPAPRDIFVFTNNGLFSDWILVKGIFASVILFLGLSISRKLQREEKKSRPSFILVIFGFTSLLLIVNYIIFAIMNDLGVEGDHGGLRAILTTIWWIALAIFMLLTGVRKGKVYHSEKLLGLLLLFLTIGKIVLYDIGAIDMQNKIIVLMIVGGALMMFSYFVHMKGWLKTNEDEIEDERDINEIILDTDVSLIEKVTFKVNGDKGFSVKTKNLVKMVSYVTDKLGKTTFKPGELDEVYEYLITNYKVELDKKSLDIVKKTFKNFVKKGGEAIFVY